MVRRHPVDAVSGDDQRAGVVARVDQPLHPAFELQAVEHHQVGLGQGAGVGGAGRVNVGVAVGADQRGDLDVLAADVVEHVGENAEAGDHLHALGGEGGGQA